MRNAPSGPNGDSSFEIEPGEFVQYNNLHGVQILSTRPWGWIEISLEGGYKCSLKLEPRNIAKIAIYKDRSEILCYERGYYDTDTEEGRSVEKMIKEIFPDFC